MDLTQILTIFASVSIPVIVGFGAFYKMTKDEIKVIREQTTKLGEHHREDLKANREETRATEERWGQFFQRMDEKMSHMDEKWERLFEKHFEGKRQA